MNQCRKPLLAVTLSALALAGCLEGAREGGNEGAVGPITGSQINKGNFPVYNPVATQFPLPEDALFFINQDNDGTALNGTDPANPVTQGLGFIDGVSVLAPFDIKISASLDAQQTLDARPFIAVDTDAEGNVLVPIEEVANGLVVPNPNQNVFLLPLEYAGGDSLQVADGEVPGIAGANDFRRARFLEERGEAGDQADAEAIYQRLLASPPVRVERISVDGGRNNAIRLLPEFPLAEKTKYAVALSDSILDAQGNPLVGAPIYQSASNPERVLTNPQIQPFRNSAMPSRQQVADFSRFKQSFFEGRTVGGSLVLPGFDDIVYSANLTTTAIEDVLLANAAPITFFDSRVVIELRQQAIERLVSGFYNVSSQPLGSAASQNEKDINRRTFERLTDPDFRLYDASLAERLTRARDNRETLNFSDIQRDSRGTLNRFHVIAAQTAVADSAEEILGATAESEAQQLALDAEALLNVPQARAVRIYNQRNATEINPDFGQTGDIPLFGEVDVDIRVFEGEITLPYYMGIPDDAMDGVAIRGSTWNAADFGPKVNLPLAVSDRITYRFPFARQVGEVKVPIVVTMPDEGAPLGTIAEPAGGYPVILYQTALTQDRSAMMPMAIAAGLLCAAEDNIDDCFVTIGIDAPLHGIFAGFEGATSDRDSVAAENGGMLSVVEQRQLNPMGARPAEDTRERHFGFAANSAMQAVPAADVETPGSGDLFLNFTNFANTLGHIRQSTLDWLNVNASLGNIVAAIADCEANGACTDSFGINTDRVYYLTHSLSGIGGVPVPRITNQAVAAGNTALNPVQGQAFLNTGGHVTRLLENSPDLSQQVLPGLEAASGGLLSQGRTELNLYFNVLQSLLDNVDPANYAARYTDSTTMLTAIVGDPADPEPLSGCFPAPEEPDPNRVTSDCTVPVDADTQRDDERFVQGPLVRDVLLGESGTVFSIDSEPAPLAGTMPLALLMDASNVLSATDTPFISLFNEGAHGNPISAGQNQEDPGSSADVFEVMTVQMLEMFLGEPPRPVIPAVLASDAERASSD
ncbi:MAG: hypothetical protein R3296_09395 [Oleiphilaceae bacterium]|nr:hypothetical protein [Oleiphilaceae bacterium]